VVKKLDVTLLWSKSSYSL